MKSWKIIAIVIAVVAVAATALTASAYAMMGGFSYPNMHGANTPGYYGNMMNEYTPSGTGGMMSGYAYTLQGTGCGNHGQISYPTNGTNPITINTAQTNAQNYIAALNNPDLVIKQVQEYSNNFYVQVTEKSTGNGAFELVVDKYTGAVLSEMGPNMMWNTKYSTLTGGMMGAGGMMSGYGYGNATNPTTTMPVNTTQATTNAQQYLSTYYPGTTTGDTTTFYGYYNIEVLNNGSPVGLISVNGYTGQAWYHSWQGTFIQETA